MPELIDLYRNITRIVVKTTRHFDDISFINQTFTKTQIKMSDIDIVAEERFLTRSKRKVYHKTKELELRNRKHFALPGSDEKEANEGYWVFHNENRELDRETFNIFNRSDTYPIWMTLDNGYTFKVSEQWQGDTRFYIGIEDALFDIPTSPDIHHYHYYSNVFHELINHVNNEKEKSTKSIVIRCHGLNFKKSISFIAKLRSRLTVGNPIVIYFILDETPRLYGVSDKAKELWDEIAFTKEMYIRVANASDNFYHYRRYDRNTGAFVDVEFLSEHNVAFNELTNSGALQVHRRHSNIENEVHYNLTPII